MAMLLILTAMCITALLAEMIFIHLNQKKEAVIAFVCCMFIGICILISAVPMIFNALK